MGAVLSIWHEYREAGISDPDSTIILNVTKPDENFLLTGYLPDKTALSRSTARALRRGFFVVFSCILNSITLHCRLKLPATTRYHDKTCNTSCRGAIYRALCA